VNHHIAIVSGAAFVAGRFVEHARDLDADVAAASVRAELRVDGLFAGDRIPRADRVTQLGAIALARAVKELPPIDGERIGVITASTMATAHTNERFERRRMEGKPPEPRAFPYTAPNAAGGEFSIVLRARGPSLALVGGHEVGLAALERGSRWIARGAAERVVVIATECPPPTPKLVAPPGIEPIEGAVAVVLERVATPDARIVTLRYRAGAEGIGATGLLSLGPLAAAWLATRGSQRGASITVASAAGASIEARVG
jgi:hypothetical protein